MTYTRQFPRLPLDVQVKVLADSDTSSVHSLGRGHDVGEGGMAVYVPLTLQVGQQVKIEFEIPHSRLKFEVQAVVRNAEGYRYGVEFIDLAGNALEELRRSIHRLTLTGVPPPTL